MSEDPIFDAYTQGKPKPKLRVIHGSEREAEPEALVLRPAVLLDPHQIPPRQWLYGSHLIRGHVSILVAPGGTGKSLLAMTMGMELAALRKLLGNHLFAQTNVAIFSLEDGEDEMQRRCAALRLHHHLPKEELAGKLFLHDGDTRGLTIAAVDDENNVVYPDEKALTEQILMNNIGLVIVDPFAESHTLEENNNPQMVRAMRAWRRIARATNCAILLVHHVRKGDIASIDAARGAKSLTDSARVGLLLTTMTKEEADGFGISDDDRLGYVRLDDAKRNLAPARKAQWFRLVPVALKNGTFEYPNGDNVAAIDVWEPPNVLSSMSDAEISDLIDEIDRGMPDEEPYAPSKIGGSRRWAGTMLVDKYGFSPVEAASRIKGWVEAGTLEVFDYRPKGSGKNVRKALRSGPLSARPRNI